MKKPTKKHAVQKSSKKISKLQQRMLARSWAKAPPEAQRGHCDSPDCGLPNCLDPFSTSAELDDGEVREPLVIVTYIDAEHRQCIRVNGQVLVNKRHMRPEKWIAFCARKICAAFGELGKDALHEHLNQRRLEGMRRMAHEEHPGMSLVVLRPEFDA